jgi:outer membrane protein assembly factor BamB
MGPYDVPRAKAGGCGSVLFHHALETLKEKSMKQTVIAVGLIALLAVLMMAATGGAEEWSRFRGPNGSGVSNATGLPVEFGPTKNLVWRREVPFGRSSPILTAKSVLVTGSEGQKLITMCLNRRTGQVMWRREISRERTQKIFKGNDTATPTPASDGKNFYVFFPDFGLVSYGPNGRERWQLKLGPFNSFYGVSGSPVVHGNTLVQVCDQKSGSFVVAVDKDTGRVRWRKERKEAMTEGYSTPIVWTPESGKAQVVVSGAYRVDAYAIDSGENVWWVGKQGTYPIATPVLANGVIFATSSGSDNPTPSWEKMLERFDKNKDGKISLEELSADPKISDHFGWMDRDGDGFITAAEWDAIQRESMSEYGLVAIRAGGAGDQTEGHLIWRYQKEYSYVASPLVYRGVLYMVKDGGIVTSLNPATGEVWKTGRSKDAIDAYFASPVAADGKVYLASHDGKVSVLKADPQWEVLAVNDLGEECQATPAIGGGYLYVRTAKALYGFGQKR